MKIQKGKGNYILPNIFNSNSGVISSRQITGISVYNSDTRTKSICLKCCGATRTMSLSSSVFLEEIFSIVFVNCSNFSPSIL